MLVGLDIGGTAIKAVALGASDEPLTERSIARRAKLPTPHPPSLPAVVHACARLLSEWNIDKEARVGVAVAGIVDSRRGEVVRSLNLSPLEGGRFAIDLAEALRADVRLFADVDAAAAAEFRALGPPRPDAWAHLRMGTGVGLAVIKGGALRSRNSSKRTHREELIAAGEVHECSCGLRGCLEAVAGGRALEEASHSAESIDRAIRATRAVLAQLQAKLGVRVVCLGGGAIEHGERFRAGIFRAPIAGVDLSPARLGDEAGAIGAALLAATPL